MRHLVLATLAFLFIPAAASADQYYSGADQARFAKLLPVTGTFRCSDTGDNKPYTATVKVEGAWVVWRENGTDPATEYIRWSPKRHLYVVVELENAGGYNVSTTTGPDPNNATWKHEYPVNKSYSTFTTSFSNGAFSVAAPYVVNGKRRVGRLSCQKL